MLKTLIVISSLIPVGIIGATRFYTTFVDLLSACYTHFVVIQFDQRPVVGIIGYWCAPYSVITIMDHSFVRRHDWSSYNVDAWNDPKKLPLGFAALLTFAFSAAIVVPCISQVWYVGPIANLGTGDIGLFTGAAMAAIVYVPLRLLEKRWERASGRGDT